MASWRNWSGHQRSKPAALHFIRSEADTAAIVREAVRAQQSIRVAGAGHSHAPLVVSDGVIVDASGLAGVVSADAATKRAWVWSGTRIYALGRALHDRGLALRNQGDIDRQAIAGAVATGTHGTGRTLQNLSATVTGVRLVAASGDVVECDAHRNAELFRAARLNLGAFGVVTQLQLQLVDAYRLQERGWSEPYETLMPKLDSLIAQSRHFEFFWYPHTDVAVAKATDSTTAEPVYPLAEEGSRCAWSYEVLSNHRPLLHTEMEYSVPAEEGPACMQRNPRADSQAVSRSEVAGRIPHARGRRRVVVDGLRASDRDDLGAPGRQRRRRAVFPRVRGDLQRVRGPAALGQGATISTARHSRNAIRAGASGGRHATR